MLQAPEHSGNFLTVDETGRPRANSDPTVGSGLKLPSMLLPEITVEDCTDPELSDLHLHGPEDQGGLFGMDATPRRRANTCPEDLFRMRKGRPPTPPPGMHRKGRKFRSGFTQPVPKETVSFAHHRLTRLAESEDADEPHSPGPGSGPTTSSSTSTSASTATPSSAAPRGQRLSQTTRAASFATSRSCGANSRTDPTRPQRSADDGDALPGNSGRRTSESAVSDCLPKVGAPLQCRESRGGVSHVTCTGADRCALPTDAECTDRGKTDSRAGAGSSDADKLNTDSVKVDSVNAEGVSTDTVSADSANAACGGSTHDGCCACGSSPESFVNKSGKCLLADTKSRSIDGKQLQAC